LAINFPKTGAFQPKFCTFDEHFPTKRKLSNIFLTAQNLGGGCTPLISGIGTPGPPFHISKYVPDQLFVYSYVSRQHVRITGIHVMRST